jgi:hypothetical protein
VRLVVDEAHFAHTLAGLQVTQNDLALALVMDHHTGFACEHNEQSVGTLALDEQMLAPFVSALIGALAEQGGLGFGQHRKNRDSTNQIQMAEQGHVGSPLKVIINRLLQ